MAKLTLHLFNLSARYSISGVAEHHLTLKVRKRHEVQKIVIHPPIRP